MQVQLLFNLFHRNSLSDDLVTFLEGRFDFVGKRSNYWRDAEKIAVQEILEKCKKSVTAAVQFYHSFSDTIVKLLKTIFTVEVSSKIP